ncbi:SusC/RagA family TonB-linked outer membrane protein [Hymenobacter sp. HSC-4F20]|uniref:SusC/RagA family TonB-linked outer membrane protein n=1 Tax=Hymenobacter sp. HSC-4F20 TaxID=2864135 RepID=UPI001C739230|nr:SusC/RagA family TonB-linked outer membrane protein [Hymenobacter sp. HSC-4F20]MBX0290807.1 SusC/RagA family TonB-linked outer membrane protein [Hymenobacter sp. HSC-4F20]
MRKILLTAALVAPVLLQQAAAQNRQISGRVTDRANGQGLPGVTVLVKGTNIGVSTNSDGTYTISAPTSATTLTFSSIGFLPIERPIGDASTIDIGLTTDSKQLGEVVVTAQNVERTRNSLPYAATQIEGENITKARNPNFINGLSGKVAGVQIRQSNTLGGSTNIVIRGTKSITGNNQPLFVVDGVPISNANTNSSTQQTGGGGYDFGNAAADINPDDIASTTILKGAAATALYGERAANGVVLITTKKGRKGFGVTLNLGATAGRIDKSTFIKYQNKYGAGYGAYYNGEPGVPAAQDNPYFLDRDINGDGVRDLVVPTSEDASYGAAFDPNLSVYQWDAFDPSSPNYGKATPWVAAQNGPDSFFKTAVTLNNSIAIDGGSDMGTFKLGYNNIRDKGIMENSQINKNIVNFSGSLNLSPKLTTSASINYTRVDGKGRYGTGYGDGNVITNFRQWWQTNVDVKAQRDAYMRTGDNVTWNWSDPNDLVPIYWNNPYWVRYKNYETDSRNRFFGNVAATYKVTDWFNILGRVSADSYDELQEERIAVGSLGVSEYSRYDRTSREYNYDLIGNFSKNITDAVSLRGLLGANLRRQYVSSIAAATNGGLIVPDLYSLRNSVNDPLTPNENVLQVGVDGIFASATVGFREMVFLDATVRRDKSTTLPSKNNTFIYPSVATSFVFSELMKDSPWLSYGKIRANYAEVGQGAPALSVFDIYDKVSTFGSTGLFSVPGTKNNPDLKPERTKSAEVGLEMNFLQNRFGFEATAYQSNSIDQILPVTLSTSTGYNSRYVNSGEVRNRGIELAAFVSPLRSTDFTWTVNANWTRNVNEVLSLYGDVKNIVLATYQGGVSSNATVGEPYGSIRGKNFVYLNGQKVVASTGYYQQTVTSNEVIGNPNPKWTGGISNTLNYKGVGLYFLVDVRHGGSIFSLDRYYGLATGLTPETAENNDLGNPSRNTIANGGGVILPGVLTDGTANTRRVSNTNYGLYGYLRNPPAAFVYDASFVKLREVSLSYALPAAIVSKFGRFKGVEISVVGRNLWIISKNLPDADPEDALSSGNLGQGYSSGSFPAVRTFGGNLRLSF